jgi:hypothetical protein
LLLSADRLQSTVRILFKKLCLLFCNRSISVILQNLTEYPQNKKSICPEKKLKNMLVAVDSVQCAVPIFCTLNSLRTEIVFSIRSFNAFKRCIPPITRKNRFFLTISAIRCNVLTTSACAQPKITTNPFPDSIIKA